MYKELNGKKTLLEPDFNFCIEFSIENRIEFHLYQCRTKRSITVSKMGDRFLLLLIGVSMFKEGCVNST